MDLIQTSIFDAPFAGQVPYTKLDNDGKVYCKLDWVTVMFFDCCMNDILSWLKLDDAVSDYLLGFFERSRGYDQRFIFTYNGVTLDTSAFDLYGCNIDLQVFDCKLPKIRLDLSGTGLDFLRSRGLDVDNYLRSPYAFPEGVQYHFTRADFAYDFINYCPEFMDNLIDYVYRNQLPSGRIPILNLTGGMTCKVVTGGQKTVYVGSPQSDRMLRLYDKRLEQMDKSQWVYKKPNPYGDPESWFRIEWQVRNQFANTMLLGTDDKGRLHDFKSILKDIFTRYCFAEGLSGDKHRNHIKPVEFWQKLFNWEDLERRIIQNANYVQPVSPVESLKKRFETVGIRLFILYYSKFGRERLLEACREYIEKLFEDNPASAKRLLLMLNAMNLYGIDLSPDIEISDICGLYRVNDRFDFLL